MLTISAEYDSQEKMSAFSTLRRGPMADTQYNKKNKQTKKQTKKQKNKKKQKQTNKQTKQFLIVRVDQVKIQIMPHTYQYIKYRLLKL